MKQILNFLDESNISYEVDYNPSPEKVERIKKAIKKREQMTSDLRESFRLGGMEKVKEYLKLK